MPTAAVLPQERIIDAMIQVARQDARIQGLAIGGSFARGAADSLSDIDLFVLLGEESFDSFVDSLPGISISLHEAPILEFETEEMEGFSKYRYKVVYRDLIVCSFHINTPETLDPHPFRRYLKPLVDSTGFLTSFIREQVDADLQFDPVAEFDESVSQFWYTCIKVYRSYKRGALWESIDSLNTLRLWLFRLIRLNHEHLFWPSRPFRSFEEDLPLEITSHMSLSLSLYDKKSVWDALTFMMKTFEHESTKFVAAKGYQQGLETQRAMKQAFREQWNEFLDDDDRSVRPT